MLFFSSSVLEPEFAAKLDCRSGQAGYGKRDPESRKLQCFWMTVFTSMKATRWIIYSTNLTSVTLVEIKLQISRMSESTVTQIFFRSRSISLYPRD